MVDSLITAADSVQTTSGNDSGWILHHIMDSRELDFEPFFTIHIPQFPTLFGLDITPTKHVFFMWLTALLLVILFYIVARSYKKSLVPKGITNVCEVMILFVRDEIVKPTLGEGYEKFVPYLLTLFFFILFGNLLGLIPYSSTFTSNIAVTATLAIFSFFAIQIGGIRQNGFFSYVKGLVPKGIPSWMLIIMIPVEILSLFTKPFALAIRLFANMIAGHIVILSMLGLIFFIGTYFVAPASVLFAIFIYLLEILVALIQAYIFTILTSLFIGMAVHQEH
ncbi:MAG: F0F1 ATP synthase subunit A [Bacteroidetes bacterium]|nr:F0F1 ATP synthase subunit A [Bacteroidota bacterium]MCH7769700.1 F0F1 ATP synthase subunit A [Bacteroidota bacterium]